VSSDKKREKNESPKHPSADTNVNDSPASLQKNTQEKPPPVSMKGEAGLTIIRHAGIFSALTLVCRLLGLWRDRLLAGIFGATAVADAFNLAFLLPNITRRIFGEGALSTAFVPIFSARLARGEKAAASRTASIVLCRLAVGLGGASLLLIGISIIGRRFGLFPESWIQTLALAEVMLPYCVLVNLAAIYSGILNSFGRFAFSGFAPALQNVALLTALYFGLDWFGETNEERIFAAAWAVLAGGILQLFAVVLPATATGFRLKVSMDSKEEGYREVMKGLWPIVWGVTIFQINILLDQLIARICIPGDGAVTVLAYGNRLIQLPTALFSIALGTAALPKLSELWTKNETEEFDRTVHTSIRQILWTAVPAAVGLALMSDDLVRLLLGTGAFLADDGSPIVRTRNVVFFYSLGLAFWSVNSVLARALYAAKELKAPTRAAAWSVVVNLGLNLTLVWHLREAGLALSSSIAAAFQTFLLIRYLKKRSAEYQPKKETSSASINPLKYALMLGCGTVVGIGLAFAAFDHFKTKPWFEGLLLTVVVALASMTPPYLMAWTYFRSVLDRIGATKRAGQAKEKSDDLSDSPFSFNVPDNFWPQRLILLHSIFTTLLCSAAMGFVVYAVKNSMPPEGRDWSQLLQRGLVPVVVGCMAYWMFSGMILSRERNEFLSAWLIKRKK
jgi:putative peptidoglycan lipid II flippase